MAGSGGGAERYVFGRTVLGAAGVTLYQSRMSKYPHLDKAPIVEALIDLRVRQREALKVDNLVAFCDAVKDRYPTRKSIRQIQTQIAFKARDGDLVAADVPGPSASQTPVGFRLES